MRRPALSLRHWLGGGVAISIGFILFRFLLTPLRIRILTELLAPADYGMVTLISMSATAMAFIFSLGGFEVWIRKLPAADAAKRLVIFRSVWLTSSLIGGLTALCILLGWGPSVWYSADGVHLSTAAVATLFLAFLHVHQRIYYLLACNEHARARITQLLCGDLWFLLLMPIGYYTGWTAETTLWIWSLWIFISACWTWDWVPITRSLRVGDGPWIRFADTIAGLSILPIVLAEWIFRLVGQYALLHVYGAETMAFYALALNLALVGFAAGVPLVDVFMTALNRKYEHSQQVNFSPSFVLSSLFTRAFRWIMAINIPVALALGYLPDALLAVLASRAFSPAAAYLPWAAFLPGFMLMNLLLGRLALTQSMTTCAAWGGMLGALISVVLSGLWAAPYGAVGVFLAVTGGLLFTLTWLVVALEAWRWLVYKEMGFVRFLLGSGTLVLAYIGIRHLQVFPLMKISMAAVATLLVWKVFRWVERKDFDLEVIEA
jgi:O-antigen/teichoic acid export membrane protein